MVVESKIKLDQKKIKKYILNQLSKGVSKQKIERGLKSEGYTFDNYKNIICRYPELDLMKRYKIFNWVTIFLLIWVMTSFFILNLSNMVEQELPQLFALFGLILPVIAIIYVIKFDRWAYSNIVVFSLILALQGIISGYPFALIPLVLLIFVSIFLFIKLYPESPLFGNFWKRKE